jgi:hypothetical protein
LIQPDELDSLVSRASHKEALVKTPEQFAIANFAAFDFQLVRVSTRFQGYIPP